MSIELARARLRVAVLEGSEPKVTVDRCELETVLKAFDALERHQEETYRKLVRATSDDSHDC